MASDIKVNNIKSYTGNTLNLGDTGDTINLTGASFNGTSSVIWDTTAKTSAFTATAGSGFFVNTTSAAITATLPASPSAGDIVAFKDYAGTFGTNNLTIARNGSNIQGQAENANITTNKASLVLVYVDATKGWLFTNESNVGNLTATVPDAPTIGTATATGTTTATVSFTAPADDGGSPITLYTATSSPDGITGTLAQAGSGTITISGLTTDTAYTFTVTATNAVGTSASSSASNSVTPSSPAYIVATGGSVSTDGDFKVHTFNSSGTLTITDGGNPDGNDVFTSLIVAGGGAGGFQIGGGGGGGGYREISSIPTGGNTGGITVTVGGGGSGSSSGPVNGSPGGNSQISSPFITTYTSAGGGGASGYPGGSGGENGGSGGGGGGRGPGGGTGNTPSVSPPQGNPGGSSGPGAHSMGGGGGGAGAAGSDSGPAASDYGNGGNGTSSSITGSPVTRAGGGGGGGDGGTGSAATGGTGGGGNAGYGPSGGGLAAQSGTANTGGGGGGSRDFSPPSGSGGSGTVIIRYKFQN